MTQEFKTETGVWTTTSKILRDGPELVLYVTAVHDTGERYSAGRRGNGVRFMAGRSLSEQLAWIEEKPFGTNAEACISIMRKLVN